MAFKYCSSYLKKKNLLFILPKWQKHDLTEYSFKTLETLMLGTIKY